MKVAREFTFDASHFTMSDKGSPCEELHGHTYTLVVTVEGPVKKDGMVMDFSEIKKIVNEDILPSVDHKNLNDVFENPTTELIAQWVFDKLKPRMNVVSVRLWEGHGKWAEAP